MEFDWDKTKNSENIRKHEIDFVDVPASFQHEGLTVMNKNDLNNTSHTNWAALESGLEENIDYSDIPPLTEEFFERATLRISADRAKNLVLLDPDVKQWFQSQGTQYKTLVNKVLRQYVEQVKS